MFDSYKKIDGIDYVEARVAVNYVTGKTSQLESELQQLRDELEAEKKYKSELLAEAVFRTSEIKRLIVDLEALKQERVDNWISVDDRLPKSPGYYFVYTPEFDWGYETFVNTVWMDEDKVFRCGFANVVKWQPLPLDPEYKEGSDDA